jgi:hypothetical protein
MEETYPDFLCPNLFAGSHVTETKVQFYKHCLILAEDLYRDSEPRRKTPSVSDQRWRKLFGAVVFLALALEAFINEIGLELCDDFHSIERLSAPDKWLIIPKLCGKDLFSRGKEPYQSIKLIFNHRNLFVHFKPQYQPEESKEYQQMSKVDHAFVEKVYCETIKAMKLVSRSFALPDMEWLDEKLLQD